MALENKIGSGTAVLYATANTGYKLTDLATSGNETVNEVIITGVAWTGTCSILRGSNTVFETSGTATAGQWKNIHMTQDPTANVQVTLTGAGTIYVEMKKKSTISNSQY